MPRRPGTGRPSVIGVAIALLAASLVTPCVVATERPLAPVPTAEKRHGTVRDLTTRLEISMPVVVTIVPKNKLMMSSVSTEGVETGGTRGDLARMLGPEPNAAVGLAAESPEPCLPKSNCHS